MENQSDNFAHTKDLLELNIHELEKVLANERSRYEKEVHEQNKRVEGLEQTIDFYIKCVFTGIGVFVASKFLFNVLSCDKIKGTSSGIGSDQDVKSESGRKKESSFRRLSQSFRMSRLPFSALDSTKTPASATLSPRQGTLVAARQRVSSNEYGMLPELDS